MSKFIIGMTVQGEYEKAIEAEDPKTACDKAWEESQFGDAFNVRGRLDYCMEITQGCYEHLKVSQNLVDLVKERQADTAVDIRREVFATTDFTDGRRIEIVILRDPEMQDQCCLLCELLDSDETHTMIGRGMPMTDILGDWFVYYDGTEYKLTVELEGEETNA